LTCAEDDYQTAFDISRSIQFEEEEVNVLKKPVALLETAILKSSFRGAKKISVYKNKIYMCQIWVR
jgi:hypothetical protein